MQIAKTPYISNIGHLMSLKERCTFQKNVSCGNVNKTRPRASSSASLCCGLWL